MKISVFGIGYVGAVSAACLADQGHHVIAVDLNPAKLACIQGGRSPIHEKGLNELIAKTHATGHLQATSDAYAAVMQSDITLVCVGTPSLPDGMLDLSDVQSACKTIGSALKNKNIFHTVVVRSTMLPGSGTRQCLPLLEKMSGKKGGEDFGFGHNPEFLREGSAVADYFSPPKIVVGAEDERSGQHIMALYEGIEAPRVITSIAVAEGVKYADNTWHALKVSFANEMGNILKEDNIDSHKVMDIFCLDEKLNLSRAYLKPGFAFGGSCLPKDVNALRGHAHAHHVPTPLLDALMESNNRQVDRAHAMICHSGARHITLLGVSFKAGTDDIRNSPLVTLGHRLLDEGYDITLYDPAVQAAAQQTDNITTHSILGPLSNRLVSQAGDIPAQTDAFVIGHHGADFSAIIRAIANDDTPIIDLIRLDNRLETRKGYRGICW